MTRPTCHVPSSSNSSHARCSPTYVAQSIKPLLQDSNIWQISCSARRAAQLWLTAVRTSAEPSGSVHIHRNCGCSSVPWSKLREILLAASGSQPAAADRYACRTDVLDSTSVRRNSSC